MVVYPSDRSPFFNRETAFLTNLKQILDFLGDSIMIFDEMEIDSRSIKFRRKFQIDRIIIFGTCNFEVYTFSNSSFIIFLSKPSPTGFLIFEIDEKIEFIFFDKGRDLVDSLERKRQLKG